MTTNINITVGGNSLVDQAKVQQQAARAAKLLQDNQARIEAEAKARREAELARQGLALDGTPLYGTPPKTRFTPDEPAANRFDEKIPCFYRYTTQSSNLLDGYIYVSGDGENSVTPVGFQEGGESPSYPALAGMLTNPNTAQSLPREGEPDGGGVVGIVTIGVNAFEPSLDREWIFRLISRSSATITFEACLGNGTGIVVAFRKIGVASQLLKYTYNFEPSVWTASIEIENPWSFTTAYSGVIIGQKKAEEITVPESIVDALDARVNLVGDYCPVISPSSSAGLSIPNGAPSLTSLLPIPVVNSFIGGPPVTVKVRNGEAPLECSSYGMALQSIGYRNAVTPFGWFYLDPLYTQKEPADRLTYTHEQFYALSSYDRTVGSLFVPRQMLTVDLEYIYSDTENSKITQKGQCRSWGQGPLTGPIVDIINSNVYDSATWRKSKKFLGPIGATGSPWDRPDLQRYFVHDWGQRGFCQQLATQYGLLP